MKKLVLLALGLFTFGMTAQAGIIYVNAQATGSNNGASWANAYTFMNSALSTAMDGDEIWVASGSYSPINGGQFYINTKLSLYGGFPNTGNPSMADRDVSLNPTIIDGDVNGDDATYNRSDNAARLFNCNANFVLDGFTLKGGGDGSVTGGAGIYVRSAKGWVNNCRFESNWVFTSGSGLSGVGGAIWADSSNVNELSDTLYVTNSFFTNNVASNGGAICAERNITVENCRFGKNNAQVAPAISIIAPYDDDKDEVLAKISTSIFYNNSTSSLSPVIHLTTSRSSSDGSDIYCYLDFCTFYKEGTTIGYESNNPSTNFSSLFISLTNSLIHLTDTQNDVFPFDFSQVTDGMSSPSYNHNLTNSQPNVGNNSAIIGGHTVGTPVYSTEDTLKFDFILSCSSPGVDEANPSTLITTDITGNPRINGSIPDIGAFESSCYTSSVESAAANQEIKLYPNPVVNQLNIIGVLGKAHIIDLTGKIVKTVMLTNNSIDVSTLTNGVYFIQVQTEKGIITQKFIKE